MAYITIKGLNKKYINNSKDSDSSVVFENFNLDIDKGDFITIFGPNACGKTTLLLIIAGLLEIDSGIVEIGCKTPKNIDAGFIFQNYRESLFPWRTALENISFPLETRGLSKKKALNKAMEFIEEIGLHNLVSSQNLYSYQLSGGLQQLVAIVRALIYKPDVLLLDEPFASLDFQTRLFLQDKLIKIWAKTKITVIFVSHEVNEAIYLGNKIVLLSKKPTKIMKTIESGFPLIRNHKILTQKNFIKIKQDVTSYFSNEISNEKN